MNPIVKKDVKVQARSMRICWGVFAYELIMALVFFISVLIIRQNIRYSSENIYSRMVWLYPILAVTQLVILGVVVPIRTSSAISGEKERQTFDIMMTTSMTVGSIIVGKAMTAIIQGMFFVVASMPVMALAFVIGGLPWRYLFWFLVIALLVSFFSASIGIFCSSVCRKSISAIILSYGFYAVFFVGTALPVILSEILVDSLGNMGSSEDAILFLLMNPAIFLSEFFVRIMTGDSVTGSVTTVMNVSPVYSFATSGYRWLIISGTFFVLISVLFLWIAARRINPIRKKRERTGGRKLRGQKAREEGA